MSSSSSLGFSVDSILSLVSNNRKEKRIRKQTKRNSKIKTKTTTFVKTDNIFDGQKQQQKQLMSPSTSTQLCFSNWATTYLENNNNISSATNDNASTTMQTNVVFDPFALQTRKLII